MREWFAFHLPTVAAFLGMLLVAAGLALAMPVPSTALRAGSPLPADAIGLPGPGEDADNDTYADAVDLAEGDLLASITFIELDVPGRAPRPYILLGTQDDHWRTGRGAELEWTHVIDPDSLGRKAGSPAWQDDVLRTGAWWMSIPAQGNDLAVLDGGSLGLDGAPATTWPLTMVANVREDRSNLTLQVELRDGSASPHARRGAWDVSIDVAARRARVDDGPWLDLPAPLDFVDGTSRLHGVVELALEANATVRSDVLARWAPTLRFDLGEAFVPVRGDLLERFHGFTRREGAAVDLRTWDFTFNHGRDGYRLFLVDFNGDGRTDHGDARLMADLLGEGELGQPTVYGHAATTTGGHVVVQYWMFYFYNFVLDDGGNDIARLQHDGDREFIQLTFTSWDAALNDTPRSVSYSQHYHGLRIDDPTEGPWPIQDGRPNVFIARGSHASYPSPGDDRRLRPSITSVHDRFDGDGLVLAPEDYRLEELGPQRWNAGYLWGPVTRYTRDLGTSTQPFLQHDFRYPFTDPLWWQASLHHAVPGELESLYGGEP